MDIKSRMNQCETLSILTLSESDQLSTELHSINGKLNSMLSTGPSSDGQHPHCLDNKMELPVKSVTFVHDAQHIPSIVAYFSIIDDNQHRKMKTVEHLFSAVGPILIKLESLVLDTSTGESDNMRLYYDFWEQQLFELLIRYCRLLLVEACRTCIHTFAFEFSVRITTYMMLLYFDFILFDCPVTSWTGARCQSSSRPANRCTLCCALDAYTICAQIRNQFKLIDWRRGIWINLLPHCNRNVRYSVSKQRYQLRTLCCCQPALKFTIR